MKTALEFYRKVPRSCLVTGAVKGTIKIWGEVVEYENGYRAQFAKITSLDWAWGNSININQLKRRYFPQGVTDGTPRRHDRKHNPDD